MIEYLIKKRKITLLAFFTIVAFGIFTLLSLPRQQTPDLVISQAMVTTVYPGATPETIEQTITKPIEQKIKELDGVDTITSTSSEGVSTILVALEGDVDPEPLWQELRTKVQDAEADLPEDAMAPVVNDDLVTTFISSYAISHDNPEMLKELSTLMTNWRDQLRTMDGIADVTFDGLPEQEIQVTLDPEKLTQYGISWGQVMQAVSGENNRTPIGDIDYNERNYQFRVENLESVELLNQVVVTTTQDGTPVYLNQIGHVESSHVDDSYFGYANGKPSIIMSISAETGSDVPSVNDVVVEQVNNLEPTLPDGYELHLLYSENTEVEILFKDLIKELIIAMIAVIVVCIMGLNLVTSALVALAIPISLAIGLLLLPLFDITLNQMTIIGIIIVLSLLVDDAIVVNDNIERKLSLGENPMDASIHGTKEVLISIIVATLCTIAAFAPLLFLPGDMGKFIAPIPTIIIVSLLASMAMSLTIVPIFREWYEGVRKKKKRLKRLKKGINNSSDDEEEKPSGLLGKQIQQANDFYANKIMPRVIKRPLLVGILGLVIGTSAFGLAAFVPVELFPQAEDPEFSIDIEMPTGTSLAETDRVVKEVAAWAEQQPEVETISYAAGGGAPQLFLSLPSGSGPEFGQVNIIGKEGLEINETIEQWNNYLGDAYPGIDMNVSSLSAGIDTGDPVSFRITGPDIDELRNIAEQFKGIIAEAEGTYNINDSLGTERYALEIVVNKAAMDEYKVSYTDLTTTLRLLTDGIEIAEFDTGTDLIDIALYVESEENQDPSLLFQSLSVMNLQGQQIPLAQLAELKPTFSVQKIERYNLERTISVGADVREGVTPTEVMTEILPVIEQLQLPSGYSWEIGGEVEQQAEAFGDLAVLFVACIIIIIILITLQFNSLSIPAIILTTVYLAAAGGFAGMFITGTAIGFMSVVGILALAGIVVRNGIVLIEFMEDARHAGATLKEAVIEGTRARFRPILLTATAAIFGLLPIAIMADILFRPMAITIISGVFFSTILTLIVVPSLYLAISSWKENRQKKKEERDAKLFSDDVDDGKSDQSETIEQNDTEELDESISKNGEKEKEPQLTT